MQLNQAPAGIIFDMMHTGETLIHELRDELAKVGINVQQLRKLYGRGKKYIDPSQISNNRIKLYEAHVLPKAYKDVFKK